MTPQRHLRLLLAFLVVAVSLTRLLGQDKRPAPQPAPNTPPHLGEAQQYLAHGITLALQKHYKAAQLELQKANALQPGDFAILFNLGQVGLETGDMALAETALAHALKLMPQSPETMYLLAQVYANDLRALDALDLLAKARDLSPKNPDLLLLMARIGISQRYYEDAIPLLEQAAQLAPARNDIGSTLGEAYFRSGRMDKAVATFEHLLPRYPSVTGYGYLGVAYTFLGKFQEAGMNLRKGLSLEPANNFCLYQLGYLAKLQGDSTTAEKLFTQVLRSSPSQPNALLSLANIRTEQKRYLEAKQLLKSYIQSSETPATGYYKLAMIEKSLHDDSASQRDLATFQELSKDSARTAHPYDHLFDYISDLARMTPDRRLQQDRSSLVEQARLHPNQPEIVYALAEAELKSGDTDQARRTIADLSLQRSSDARTLTGLGVLLARYGLTDDAIRQFQLALLAAPGFNDACFDLATAYLHKGNYSEALATVLKTSEEGRTDNSYSTLLADIYVHLGDIAHAESLYQNLIERTPDKDQVYLSLALLQLRQNDRSNANSTLRQGQSRIPGSGKLAWGFGLCALLDGNIPEATAHFQTALDLLPEWPGSYATLGFLYFQTGQIDKAREVLDRFKNSESHGGLDINRITETLGNAPAANREVTTMLSTEQRMQVFQLAVYLADRTL